MSRPAPFTSPFLPRRVFLGWDRPLLASVVDALTTEWLGGVLDLSNRLVVVPTRQSGRRLREALAERAALKGVGVFPPRVLTTEALFSEVRPAGRPVATSVESLMAWATVLEAIPIGDYAALFPQPPLRPDFAWAVRLARSWQEVRRVLGEGGWSMGTVAARLAADTHPEAARWADLARLEIAYLDTLARIGRDDDQVARQQAAMSPVYPAGIKRLEWLGVTDPPESAVQVAVRLGELGCLVTVWIAAPSERGSAFDDWGRPCPDAWISARDMPLPLDRIHLAAGPVEQAVVVRSLAAGHMDPGSTLGLGVADTEVADALLALAENGGDKSPGGFPCHRPDGVPAGDHELWHVLNAWSQLARERSFRALGRWLRFPVAAACLKRRSGLGDAMSQARLLEAWDAYLNDHLPQTLADGRSFEDPVVNAMTATAEKLLDDFSGCPLSEAVSRLLTELYDGRRFSTARSGTGSFIALARELTEWIRQVDRAVQALGATPSPGESLAMVLDLMRDIRLDELDRAAEAVDVNGWLEIAWDPAPHVIVAGMNDGRLPEVIVGHAYLPESLRVRLGLHRTNSARLARDAHQLQALLCSREGMGGRVDVVLGRASAAGDALRPSRLLFLRPDDELPDRVAAVFGDERLPCPPAPPGRRLAWRLRVPSARQFERLSVTAIRSYLTCPFRFYLRHGLRMEEVDPEPRELDGAAFGVLCHAALKVLVVDPALRRCSDESVVADGLRSEVRRLLRASHGEALTVPLQVQLASAERRLAAAAAWHAASIANGWEPVHAEVTLDELVGTPFLMGGLEITGRIDRVDARGEQRRIIDFKTNDSPHAVAEAHLGKALSPASVAAGSWPPWQLALAEQGKSHAWRDLQLPLYALAGRQAWGRTPEVGYFQLAKAVSDCTYHPWTELTDGLIEQAAGCARAVVEAIQAGVFWPPRDVDRYDDFAWMLPGGVEQAIDPSALKLP
ncbi:MAG: PD-(D/E)XK nuclease family protein [Verrucomicrobiales bacterium]